MYFLSVISIFKNEATIIKEWIRHYIEEGVEHFYLIENGSSDDFESQIEEYKDKITLFRDSAEGIQVTGYDKYMIPKFEETEWLILCDLDEFIWAPDKNNTIASVLRSLDDNVGAIKIPWIMYGSSGHISQPDSVVPNFTKRVDYDKDETRVFKKRDDGHKWIESKCIARGSAATNFAIHHIYTKSDYKVLNFNLEEIDDIDQSFQIISNEKIKTAKLRLNHYPIQSLEWFKKVKMTRGDAFGGAGNRVRDENYFREYDLNDIDDDELYQKHKHLYADHVKKENEDIEHFITIYKDVNIYTLLISLVFMLGILGIVMVYM